MSEPIAVNDSGFESAQNELKIGHISLETVTKYFLILGHDRLVRFVSKFSVRLAIQTLCLDKI